MLLRRYTPCYTARMRLKALCRHVEAKTICVNGISLVNLKVAQRGLKPC